MWDTIGTLIQLAGLGVAAWGVFQNWQKYGRKRVHEVSATASVTAGMDGVGRIGTEDTNERLEWLETELVKVMLGQRQLDRRLESLRTEVGKTWDTAMAAATALQDWTAARGLRKEFWGLAAAVVGTALTLIP